MREQEELQKILRSSWDVEQIHYIEEIDRSFSNRNWWVTTPTTEYVLRQVAPWRINESIPDYLQYQHGLLSFLSESPDFNYSVPVPIMTKDKITFRKRGGSYYWLYEKVPGRTKSQFGRDEDDQVANLITDLHFAVNNYRYDNFGNADYFLKGQIKKRIDQLLHQYYNEEFSHNSEELDQFLRRLDTIERIYLTLDSTQVDFNNSPIHADLSKDNLLWDNTELVGLIDFEFIATSKAPILQEIVIYMINAHLDLLVYDYRRFYQIFRQFLNQIITLTDGKPVESTIKFREEIEHQTGYLAEFLIGTCMMFTITTLENVRLLQNPRLPKLYDLIGTLYKNRDIINQTIQLIP